MEKRKPEDIRVGEWTLARILERHRHWLYEDCEGWEGMRADLSGADLHDADLHDADLRYASLAGTNLHGADLNDAILRYADLSGADLSNADLDGTILRDACLYQADLTGADLSGADLYNADLKDTKGLPFIPLACPEMGSFIAYIRVGDHIVVLEICEDARRSSATSRRCRCDKARVIRIEEMDGSTSSLTEVTLVTGHGPFVFKVGETVTAGSFNEDRWSAYGSGIPFFINRQEEI